MFGRAGVAVIVMAAVLAGCSSSGTAAPGDAPQLGSLVVLDADTGRTLWMHHAIKGRMISVGGSGARSILASDQRCTDESIGRGRLVAYDAGSGVRRWSRRQTGVATKTDVWGVSPTVDVGAGGVVVTPGGRFGPRTVVFSEESGRTQWSADEPFLGASARHVFTASTPDQAVLVARDRRTGRRQWTFPTTPSTGWTTTFDVVAANREHTVVANGNYLARSGDRPGSATTFFVLDARTGQQLVSFEAADPSFQFSDMVLAGGAFVYGEGQAVVARDLTTGAVRWSRAFSNAASIGSGIPGVFVHATTGEDVLLVQLQQREAPRVVALDARSGAVRWEHPDASVGIAGPTVTVLQPHAGGIVAIATQTGTPQWRTSKTEAITGRYGQLSLGLSGRRLAVSALCDVG